MWLKKVNMYKFCSARLEAKNQLFDVMLWKMCGSYATAVLGLKIRPISYARHPIQILSYCWRMLAAVHCFDNEPPVTGLSRVQECVLMRMPHTYLDYDGCDFLEWKWFILCRSGMQPGRALWSTRGRRRLHLRVLVFFWDFFRSNYLQILARKSGCPTLFLNSYRDSEGYKGLTPLHGVLAMLQRGWRKLQKV